MELIRSARTKVTISGRVKKGAKVLCGRRIEAENKLSKDHKQKLFSESQRAVPEVVIHKAEAKRLTKINRYARRRFSCGFEEIASPIDKVDFDFVNNADQSIIKILSSFC